MKVRIYMRTRPLDMIQTTEVLWLLVATQLLKKIFLGFIHFKITKTYINLDVIILRKQCKVTFLGHLY